MIKEPVLFIFFNRAGIVRRVFREIKKARPASLYLASDGPRVPEEQAAIDAIRNYVLSEIDWPCEVKTNFRQENRGTSYGIKEFLDWFFACEESGIIVEEDCLPNQSFFTFCEEMLSRYRDEDKIMSIGGSCFFSHGVRDADYFFSEQFFVWGWACWRRTWQLHQQTHDQIAAQTFSFEPFWGRLQNLYGQKVYENAMRAFRGEVQTWDYQLWLTIYMFNGLTVVPAVNLVTNLGINKQATNTRAPYMAYLGRKRRDLPVRLRHPKFMVQHTIYDLKVYRRVFYWAPWLYRKGWALIVMIRYLFRKTFKHDV